MKVYVSRGRITQDQALSAERTTVENCWDGTSLEAPLEWSLVCDDLRVWFVCRIPGRPTFDQAHARGAFVEGLWEHDVAEFFLMDAEGRYQEFNVSPTGAWWSCGFSGYRARAAGVAIPTEVLVETKIDPTGWQVLFSVPSRELWTPLERIAGVHVAAISRSPHARYLSSSPVLGSTPDFHRRECFGAVEWVVLSGSGVSV
jgi:hypothetical protein